MRDKFLTPDSYEKADQFVQDWKYYMKMNCRASVVFFKILVYLIYDLCLLAIEKVFCASVRKDISNQIAVVTGGANGLGREIACRLAAEKCNIVIVDINYEAAKTTAEFIANSFNVKTKAFKVNVSKFEEIQKLKNDIETSLGPVDILVNNAAIMPYLSLREGSPQDIQKIIDVNVLSHCWTNRVFLDGMIDRKRGHIVGISSLAGKAALPCAIAYTSTKHAVTGFMRSLYDEICAYDYDEFIKTTAVYPWFINTRKELEVVLEIYGSILDILTPEYVADQIVESILKNQREVTIPNAAKMFTLSNYSSDKNRKKFKMSLLPSDFKQHVLGARNLIKN